MREKEPQFTVTDRRKFTAEGELREGQDAPAPAPAAATTETAVAEKEVTKVSAEPADRAQLSVDPAAMEPEIMDEEAIPEPTAAEFAQLRMEYQVAGKHLDEMWAKANPGQSIPPAVDFDRMVQSLYMNAAMQMGAGAQPNEQPRIDIMGARQSIDTLMMLSEKTKGNLTAQQKRLLENAHFDLAVSFLEITNAIASSAAQRAPKSVKPH